MTGELSIQKIYEVLQKLVGLHRQLYESCRAERDALVAADVKLIQEQTHAKELVIETIKQYEMQRIRASASLSLDWKIPLVELSLTRIIQELEPKQPKEAEKFRSALNALTVLIERSTKMNNSNREFLERSLEHVHEMKRNVLGEAAPQSDTYGSQGQKVPGNPGARFISQEA